MTPRPAGRTTSVAGKAKSRMALTRAFRETVQARARRNPAFRDALLAEGVNALLAGDLETGKSVLRDFINATVGFEKLASATGTPPKSLMRMFSPAGNPRASNLLSILSELQRASGVRFHAQCQPEPALAGTGPGPVDRPGAAQPSGSGERV